MAFIDNDGNRVRAIPIEDVGIAANLVIKHITDLTTTRQKLEFPSGARWINAHFENLYGPDGSAQLTAITETTARTIGAGAANDTELLGVLVSVALTGTCVIAGFGDEAGNAKNITLPTATPAGFYAFGGVNRVGALTVTCSNAGDDDDVWIKWRPIRQVVKLVINAASDADADGKLATADAHNLVYAGVPFWFTASSDDPVTRIDVIATSVIGSQQTRLQVHAGV